MITPEKLIIEDLTFEVLIPEKDIQARIQEIAGELSDAYPQEVPIMIGVLNGAVLFMADLIRNMSIDCEMDFIKISSYGNQRVSSGEITMVKDFSADLYNRHIIVVEDIVDSGLSAQYLKRRVQSMKPASIKFVSLLTKKDSLKVEVDIDHVGFEIENKFVVGYGLDFKQQKRNVNAIYQLVKGQ